MIVSAAAWAYSATMIKKTLTEYLLRRNFRIVLTTSVIVFITGVIALAAPLIRQKEQLLQDVRDVRFNANDAIKWMAHDLPPSATVLVSGPHLYGIERADDLTSQEDEVKLYGQYTFLQGYVRSYFKNLGRFDLKVAYLEDSTTLESVLDSFRENKDSYLFLQTGLDRDRFHSMINGKHQLAASDLMAKRFERGKYPCEVWQIRR
jgi:hypothetical protein